MDRRSNPSVPLLPLLPATPEHRRQLVLALLRRGSDSTGGGFQQRQNSMTRALGQALMSVPTGNTLAPDPVRERNGRGPAGSGLGNGPNEVVRVLMERRGLLPRSKPGDGLAGSSLFRFDRSNLSRGGIEPPGLRVLAGLNRPVSLSPSSQGRPVDDGPDRGLASALRPAGRPGASGLAPRLPGKGRETSQPPT